MNYRPERGRFLHHPKVGPRVKSNVPASAPATDMGRPRRYGMLWEMTIGRFKIKWMLAVGTVAVAFLAVYLPVWQSGTDVPDSCAMVAMPEPDPAAGASAAEPEHGPKPKKDSKARK